MGRFSKKNVLWLPACPGPTVLWLRAAHLLLQRHVQCLMPTPFPPTYMHTFCPRNSTPAQPTTGLIFLSDVLKGMKTSEFTVKLPLTQPTTFKTRDLKGSVAELNFISQCLLIFYFPEVHIRWNKFPQKVMNDTHTNRSDCPASRRSHAKIRDAKT